MTSPEQSSTAEIFPDETELAEAIQEYVRDIFGPTRDREESGMTSFYLDCDSNGRTFKVCITECGEDG